MESARTMVELIETLGNQIRQAASEEKFDHPIINKIINFLEMNIDETLKKFDSLRNAG